MQWKQDLVVFETANQNVNAKGLNQNLMTKLEIWIGQTLIEEKLT